MAKGGGKSSASSATRKKHAAKKVDVGAPATAPGAPPKEKKPKSKEKGKGKKVEPRKKVFILPTKPAPIQPDPLETTGIAHRLPPELVVILRSLSKKAVVTKGKALEDLKSGWLDRVNEDEEVKWTMSVVVPVWMHHLPSLFVHPSRRIRQLTADLHRSMVTHLAEYIVVDSTILSTWCIAAHDIDRAVSFAALQSLRSYVKTIVDPAVLTEIPSFVFRAALDPLGVYDVLNPQPTAAPPLPPNSKRGTDTPPTRAKVEDLEEKDEDRKARIRVGALGAMGWVLDNVLGGPELMHPALSNPGIWSSLYGGSHPPFLDGDEDDEDGPEGFGFEQPSLRRAGWVLLSTVLRSCEKERIQVLLPVISPAILRSAWIERDSTVQAVMWAPLLRFLKDFSSAWEIERSQSHESDSESDEDDKPPRPSMAYKEFLRFLELGCSGSPMQGYPTVVIILSTIPPSIFTSIGSPTPIRELFTSFWAAVDGRALSGIDRLVATRAFLSATFECLILLLRRIGRGHAELGNGAELLEEQVGRLFEGIREMWLKVDPKTVAHILAGMLKALGEDGSWGVVRTEVVRSADDVLPSLVKTFEEEFAYSEGPLREQARALKRDVAAGAIGRCRKSLEGDEGVDSKLLVEMIQCYGVSLWEDERDTDFNEALDAVVQDHSYKLLVFDYKLMLSFLKHRCDKSVEIALWKKLLQGASSHPEEISQAVSALLDIAAEAELDVSSDGVLDAPILELYVQSLHQRRGEDIALMKRILEKPTPVLSPSGYKSVLDTLQSALEANANSAVYSSDLQPDFGTILSLLLPISEAGGMPHKFLADIFVLAFVLKEPLAVAIWGHGHTFPGQDVYAAIVGRLKAMVCDTHVCVGIEDLAQAANSLNVALMSEGNGKLDPWSIVPDAAVLDGMLDASEDGEASVHPSLAVDDVLVPPGDAAAGKAEPLDHDLQGLSVYARAVQFIALVCAEDRQRARRHLWVLRHLITFELFADDLARVPYAGSHIFASDADVGVESVKQVVSYLLMSGNTLEARVGALGVGTDKQEGGLGTVLRDQIEKSKSGSVRESRVLYRMLVRVLGNADKAEADRWFGLARTVEKVAPQACMAIIHAIVNAAPEPPRLDRFRNELAASLLGISASQANTVGLLVLRKLVACAPPADSEIVFLPQPRAVNMIKVLQKWVMDEDDEGIDEQVESAIAAVLIPVVPILQGIEGSHWEFVFDVVENGLQTASLTDDETYVALARSLRLLGVLMTLAEANRMVRELWNERKKSILERVRDLAMEKLDDRASVPRSVCLQLVLDVVQDLPEDLIGHETLSKMCHLITDSDSNVQRTAYRLLQKSAYKRTEHYVVEAAVAIASDTEDGNTFEAALPDELISILIQEASIGGEQQTIFGCLLGWSLLFDLFVGSSLKVKGSYIDQLRRLDLVADSFIPTIITLLNMDEGAKDVFRLEPWAVDEFYVQLYEPDPSSFPLQVFGAHLYYRALMCVPSLVHGWLLECKDRQLSARLTLCTSAHFSPVLIAAEISLSAFAELEDEAFKVRVLGATNEVVASYSVDEHILEMRVKVPSDWPLRRIEVTEGKRVGVEEGRWRRWMFAIGQVVWGQNGRIVDALGLFKKNVSLHFEGKVECAICYSIISVMDGTLPQRPCRTCKNRFHGGCLYKWFNTSHSSSCPLCRSDMF